MIERTTLGASLSIPRIVTGLWQVADIERHGKTMDPDAGSAALAAYVRAGFDTFDMADHYGTAEIITGHLAARARRGESPPFRAFTKWCPEPQAMSAATVRGGVDRARQRMQCDAVDLMQFHWWTYDDPRYLDALHELARLRSEQLIREIGLTNFDADHLGLVLADGVPVVSNQVSLSLIDRRALGRLSQVCLANDVRLLAYGTLCGGFLSERWLGASEPAGIADWSRMKYKRFIDAAGGWSVFQRILGAAHRVAQRHGVSVANVATRWVLDQPAVAAVIVGARLTEAEHRDDNARVFSFALDVDDHARLDEAMALASPIPGDCGDEYRRPPFLTASGDLSHHLSALEPFYAAEAMPRRPGRTRVSTGSIWETVCGFSRAVRVDGRILVSGTTATHHDGRAIAPDDPAAQTVYILDKIAAALKALGGTLDDVVRTRVYIRDAAQWEAVSAVHGRYFVETRPANTLVEARLVGDYLVEIEAEAIVG
jgi:aryl-alcohol dehydrogenase-like predicted oxidoreductase/enamine deaminase RidA (YjgF/YER057c/UK114 family)